MTVKDDLIAARKLIEKPENWMQGAFTNNAHTAFCGVGAIRQAICGSPTLSDMDAKQFTRYAAARDKIESLIESRYLPSFNDAHSHSDILALFDRAINAAGA